MTVRRLASAVVALWLAAPGTAAAAKPASSPASEVNPFVGTADSAPDFGTGGGAGNTFPGAAAPFGMLAWSPDSVPGTVNFAGRYSYPDHELSGFSLTHLSGAGCAVGGDISFLPTTAPVTVSPAKPGSSDLDPRYLASFSHAAESASPGRYAVTLDPGSRDSIGVELAALPRAGAGRFSFPRGASGSVLINAGASASADTYAGVQIDPAARTVTGSASSGRFCYQHNTYTVYFAARFSRRFSAHGTWTSGLLQPGSRASNQSEPSATNYLPIPGGPPSLPGDPSGTAQSGAYLTFAPAAGQPVEVRVGLSYVSSADALGNLDAEAGNRSFTGVAGAATRAWNQALGAIQIAGGRERDRRTFYTALYHALLEPSLFSDENGRYPGMDGRVHTAARGHAQYANFSGWDVYRTQIPLLAMLEPARTSDIVQSLVTDAAQSGWLPKWPVADAQTDVMVGDSADPIIAAAYAFGARGFDVAAALGAIEKGALQPGSASEDGDVYVERPALLAYEQHGYIPAELNTSSSSATFAPLEPWGAASTTLEYASDDFAAAQFALRAACRPALARQLLARSGDWENLFDPGTRTVAERAADGSFVAGTSPTSTDGFVEGDAAQYTWLVPFDLRRLFTRLGGSATARRRLDAFFSTLNSGPASTTAFLGNEPTLETPWEYDWLGAPYRTQSVVRRALLTLYGPGPGNMPGNDDLGAMSAWYVLGAIGLYPEIPGVPVLALGSPLFPRTTLSLGGRRIVLLAPGASDATPYVSALHVGRHVWSRPWLSYATLSTARRLTFSLTRRATPGWGSVAAAAPPSYPAAPAAVSCSAGP